MYVYPVYIIGKKNHMKISFHDSLHPYTFDPIFTSCLWTKLTHLNYKVPSAQRKYMYLYFFEHQERKHNMNKK